MLTVRNLLGSALILVGAVFYIITVIGNYKFKYVLNRMHAAGIADSLASVFVFAGCVVINGLSLTSLKLCIAAGCLFITAPVCSHMLAKLEADTNENIKEEAEVQE